MPELTYANADRRLYIVLSRRNAQLFFKRRKALSLLSGRLIGISLSPRDTYTREPCPGAKFARNSDRAVDETLWIVVALTTICPNNSKLNYVATCRSVQATCRATGWKARAARMMTAACCTYLFGVVADQRKTAESSNRNEARARLA